jgi:hypothetical protein
MYYIYEIKNNISNKTYIGQRKCPANKTPETDLYSGSGVVLHKAYEKYGKENFTKTILAIVGTKENINILEKVFIALYRAEGKDEYNIANGGDGLSSEWWENNPEIREVHRINVKKSHNTLEFKLKKSKQMKGVNKGVSKPEGFSEKLRQANLGKKASEETKKKISENNKGKIAWNKNKHGYLSEESKQKIRLSRLGKPLSKETREKMSGRIPWNKGMNMSEDFRKKLSESHKGYQWSEESKRKLSEINKGRVSGMKGKKQSEEAKNKISEKMKNRVVSEETRKKLSEKAKLQWKKQRGEA